MKKSLLIGGAILALGAGLWFWTATRFRISWEILESRLPSAAEGAGWRVIEQQYLGSDVFPLSVRSRIRQVLHPQRHPPFVSGFPNSTVCYTFESDQSHARVQCFVRYSEGMVLRLWVRYAPTAKQEAISLRGILQRTFPGECISADEITEAQPTTGANSDPLRRLAVAQFRR